MKRRGTTLGMMAIIALSAALTGCGSMVPFTHEIRSTHDLSNDDLRSLQFYVSNDVKLRRELHTKGRTISDGNLKLHAGKAVEEIVIPEKTPGVAVAIDDHTIRISFEEGSSLEFSLRTAPAQPLVQQPQSLGFAEPPDAFPGERWQQAPRDNVIFVDSDVGSYWLDADEDGLVSYRGKTWEAIEDSFRAHLMIDAESLEEVVENQTTLRGRRL